MKIMALALIRLYQVTLSRVSSPSCRYIPSCSQYGYEAIQRYGLIKGGWLTLRRLARCNPWARGGVDLVP
ncbi:MAG: membrane protein insertion efficiency factor YidD [Chloroflexi bacterium]|nr:membrane protein insertion efficiency factor YidD [Chloroflexota bacterium]